MSEFKKCNVIMLPTGDITGIVLHSTGLDKIVHTKESELKAVLDIGGVSQHLYITSKEQIEEGNWYYNSLNHTISQADKRYGEIKNPMPHRKIVATTDKSLLEDFRGYEYGTAREYSAKVYLPQIPQSFIKQYVESGGIDDIELEIGEKGAKSIN